MIGLVTAFLAGALTTLNPCVLPMLPLVLAGASAVGRRGALAMAGGLIGSFTVLGIGLAILGPAIGLDPALVRQLAAILLVITGFVLVHPPAQTLLMRLLGPIADRAQLEATRLSLGSIRGQFGLGVLLGAVWSPCVGPTLGVAVALAANGRDLAQTTVTMAVFAAGMATVLLGVGSVSKAAFRAGRAQLSHLAATGRRLFGVLIAALGISVLSGLDKVAEAFMTRAMPGWLLDLTTRF